jgi:hypothetical protein
MILATRSGPTSSGKRVVFSAVAEPILEETGRVDAMTSNEEEC